MIVALGNRSAAQAVTSADGTKTMEPMAKAKRATIINFDDEMNLASCLRALTDGDGIVANHFTPGTKPAWVASENQKLAELIADNYGGIEVRELQLEGGVAAAPDTDADDTGSPE